MDILSGKITLLFITSTVFIVFLVYSVTAIRRIGIVAYFKAIAQVGKVIASALGAFVTSILGLLASSAQTSNANEATTNAASGGMLNYRTGKLDDGTDPAGMYEKD
jgi:hypothetical protein